MTWVLAILARGAGLALLWWVLTEGRSGYAVYGALAVPVALAVSLWLAPPSSPGTAQASRREAGPVGHRLVSVPRLIAWYAVQVTAGAVDVARRLLRRRPDVAPVVVETTTRLPEGPWRQLAVAMYGLMPGSLVCDTDGGRLRLHTLAEELDPIGAWRELEDHLARAAGLELPD
ncbi:Na+/H+ antiporter subunit E [Ornithinimicrobium sp. Y1847]|uniref:Na+/H+ antiporter subunit E n=1 Tax=unclassified Ornithinimicrobium TaxID=2615080 RepID=UPI003B6798AF